MRKEEEQIEERKGKDSRIERREVENARSLIVATENRQCRWRSGSLIVEIVEYLLAFVYTYISSVDPTHCFVNETPGLQLRQVFICQNVSPQQANKKGLGV